MHVPDISDAAWVSRFLAQEAGRLGLPGFSAVRLLDAQILNPHRPDSPRCRGWATYRLEGPDGAEDVLLCLQAFPDRDPVVWRFPDDPVLGGLRGLLAAGHDAARLVGRDDAAGVTAARRAVAARTQLHGALRRARHRTVRGLRQGRGRCRRPRGRRAPRGAVAGRRELAAAGRRAAGLRDRLQVLWTRGVPGPSFAATPWRGVAQALGAAAAATVAALHASAVVPPRRVVVADCVAEARKKVAKLSTALPSVAPPLARVLAGTEAALVRAAPARELTVHGDLHLDQLIATAHGAVLLDLDELGLGPPELDAAELVVDAVTRESPGGDDARRVRSSLPTRRIAGSTARCCPRSPTPSSSPAATATCVGAHRAGRPSDDRNRGSRKPLGRVALGLS